MIWHITHRLRWLTGFSEWEYERCNGTLNNHGVAEHLIWLARMRGDRESELAVRQWVWKNS